MVIWPRRPCTDLPSGRPMLPSPFPPLPIILSFHGAGMLRSRHIFRARSSLISECRGTGAVSPVAVLR